ncbi:alanine dehydrogenase [Uliginosibacterium sp. 31-12]|uniref:alanine dehydrogenase n=1 Tax=Uliginosibacterium sp. 31-12 TaxID=3062781 RepID=UPI0026E31D9B|nr:alanine dehydrogenase [Uliginosibacterium sp. 31-12]MDO6387541.1 alanine dehydrogenase [Uliginosibacterium sp. 31-12]
MRVGVAREIKNHEYRVGLTPASVRELVAQGHELLVEQSAGLGIGATDADYQAAGARIVSTAAELFATADMIVKVKEPQPAECAMLRPGQILFTYLHLAPDPEQAKALLASGAICVAYETVTAADGSLPLLAPMSEVAGRMSVQAGAHCLEKAQGGRGVLLPGVPGVLPGKVVILGGGVVGSNAALVAAGMGADVTVVDRSPAVLKRVAAQFGTAVKTLHSTREALEAAVCAADLVIGAVLVPGAAAPRLISRELLSRMQPGSVIVDVAIDQGGCCETSHATTHAEPTYVVNDVVHYCVANMPGAVARTSTYALNAATLPFAIALAGKGWKQALKDDVHLRHGLNVCEGKLTCKEVADALVLPYTAAESVLQ